MNSNLFTALCKPPIYTKTEVPFWDDEYISKQMLDAHLNPEIDAASRRLEFIDNSVEWIRQMVPPSEYPTLIDLGCGPGLYAERFTKMGYRVTGIDFSKCSIDYAKQTASSKQLDISYKYQNYLEINLGETFDFATLIYCDYGALSTEDRRIILNRAYQHLRPGGKLLFDVFTMKKYEKVKEQQTWWVCHKNGFWRADEHIEMNASYKYLDHVILDLTVVISKNDITPYYIWDTCFTKESLIQEVERSGFKVRGIFGDVTGSMYQPESETIAILLEK
ncbi:class I SAM-dependent methyltransferase [Lachnoclostridium phytofermentans]|uniref:class I SAM-dependent methyltransferase n=1 Tax=Lachnoclostridium phytofermentans TaxID=66219 RepID=UPI0004984B7D|nr:class I SAM-dependent methyltransferase [Lachnoclostridium phytofermentans]